jgi:protease IV
MPSHSFGREVANVSLRVVAVVVGFILVLGISSAWVVDQPVSDGSCNIAVLPIDGVIAPYGELMESDLITNPHFVRTYLEAIEEDILIEGVLVEINSPGGTPVAAETIADLVAESSLPTVGLIGDLGASGGYMVAAATDYLIASPMSLVGSIGVTMSYLENTKQNEEEGLTFVELTSGDYKEAGNPNRPLSEEERARFERDLDIVHEAFVSKVAAYRDLPVEEVQGLADGSGYTGKDALDKKLVDALGGRALARQHFADTLGMNVEDVHFCEYAAGGWWI